MTKLSTMLENLLTIIDRDTEGKLCEHSQEYQESLTNDIEYPCDGIRCDACILNHPSDTEKDRDRLLQLIKTVELIDHE